MTIAYRNFSKNAATSERLGNFSEAARFWSQACALARGINREWAELRADYCLKMAERASPNQAA